MCQEPDKDYNSRPKAKKGWPAKASDPYRVHGLTRWSLHHVGPIDHHTNGNNLKYHKQCHTSSKYPSIPSTMRPRMASVQSRRISSGLRADDSDRFIVELESIRYLYVCVKSLIKVSIAPPRDTKVGHRKRASLAGSMVLLGGPFSI